MKPNVKLQGKAFARGGPASLRNKKAKLRQSKLPTSPDKRTISSTVNGDTKEAEDEAVVTPNRKRKPKALPLDSGSDDGRAHVTFKTLDYPSDNEEAPSPPSHSLRVEKANSKLLAASDPAYNAPTQSAAKRMKARRSKLEQSKIQFKPGGSRYISTDPIDSEEEEFRGTQFAPSPVQRDQRKAETRAIEIESDSASNSVEELITNETPGRANAGHSEDSDEEALVTPMRRRKRFMPKARSSEAASAPALQPRKRFRKNEVVHDARDLDNKLIKTSKHRQANTKKDAFKSHLERLRRKKAGLPSESEDDEEAADGSDLYKDEEPEEDWIVEDDMDRNTLLDGLPAEFQQPRQPLEQFKIAVQWEILDLLMSQGGFAPDAYFKPAIDWLRDRTSGKFQAAISSIWRRPFVRALQRGPEINSMETGNLGYYCDACGRTNRVATYVVKFEGARYDHLTLEDLASDADSSEDDLDVDENAASDEEEERARKERILRAEWNLGINCYERTCVAHELFHLRKHLREEIYAKLNDLGLFSAAKVYERSTMAKSKRTEFVNQVTEQLDNARFQQRLWSRYKATIEKNENYIVDPNAGRKRSKYLFS